MAWCVCLKIVTNYNIGFFIQKKAKYKDNPLTEGKLLLQCPLSTFFQKYLQLGYGLPALVDSTSLSHLTVS